MPGDREFLGQPGRCETPLPDDLGLLSTLGRVEATAIRHLERSNVDLLTELQFAEDTDLRGAVEDNLVMLQRRYQRLADISEKVSRGLVIRARLVASERGGGVGSAGAVQGAVREGSADALEPTTFPASPALAAGSPVPAAGPGDDSSSTLTRMQTLLRQVKRKAAELEEDLISGDLSSLGIAPRWERKAARLQEGAALAGLRGLSLEAAAQRETEDTAGAACEGMEVLEGEVAAGQLEPLAPHAVQDAAEGGPASVAVERLGALLRGVRRKAAELEEDVVSCSFSGLSITDPPLMDPPTLEAGAAPELDARRREAALTRPRTRPKTTAAA